MAKRDEIDEVIEWKRDQVATRKAWGKVLRWVCLISINAGIAIAWLAQTLGGFLYERWDSVNAAISAFIHSSKGGG